MRPNILWICTDQQRYDTIGALNNPQLRSPNIDRLVGGGVSCERAYCQSPIRTPSRASFLTGMYPSSVPGCGNGNEYWAEAAPLVTALLADAGYDCALAGKLHLAGARGRIEPRPQHDGYRTFHWSHGPHDYWQEGHDYADWLLDQGCSLADMLKQPHETPPALHQTAWRADRAIDFIVDDHAGEPWLMSVNIFDPHSPFDPPQPYLDRFDSVAMPGPKFRESDLAAQAKLSEVDFQTEARGPEDFEAKRIQAAYYAMIELIDDNVGRMLDALEGSGQLNNTIVIFTSDHGEMLGEHGMYGKSLPYDSALRTPLICRGPGVAAGQTISSVESTLDIAPTRLNCAGVAEPVA